MVPIAESKTANFRSIAQEFRRLTLVTMLPLVLIIAALGFGLYQTEIRQTQEFLRDYTNNIEFNVTHFLAETAQGLSVIAKRPSVIRMDPAHCDTHLPELIAIQTRYANANVTDRDGWVICGATNPTGGPRSINVSDRDWFQAAMAGQPFALGAARKGPILGRWVITAAAPVKTGNGNIVGVVSVAIDLEKWSKPDHLQATAHDTIQGILDQTGMVIMRAPEPEKWVGTTNPDQRLFDKIISVGQGTFTAKGRQGFERIWSVKSIPNTNWIAYSAARADLVLTPLKRYAMLMAISLAIVLLTTLFFSIRASRTITSSITALATASQKVASGDSGIRAAVTGPLEIAAVAWQFNRMLDAIDQNRQVLRESEYRWKFALEGAGDGLWDWDVAEGTVFFSKRWKEMLGYSEDEIDNRLEEWEMRIHPEDKPLTLAAVQDHLDGRSPAYNNEHRVRCKDGSYKWILDRGMVVSRGEDGKPLRMIGTHADMTERRLAAEALQRQSEELLQRTEELSHFNRIMVGRELDIIDLKRQVNALSLELGRAAPFNLAFADAPPAPPAPPAPTSEAKDSTPPAAGAP